MRRKRRAELRLLFLRIRVRYHENNVPHARCFLLRSSVHISSNLAIFSRTVLLYIIINNLFAIHNKLHVLVISSSLTLRVTVTRRWVGLPSKQSRCSPFLSSFPRVPLVPRSFDATSVPSWFSSCSFICPALLEHQILYSRIQKLSRGGKSHLLTRDSGSIKPNVCNN